MIMRNVIYCLLLSNLSVSHAAMLSTDAQAYNYCLSHQSSFIAIVWPIAQGKDNRIEQIFNKFGRIIYRKIVYFTPKKAYKLLKQAHYNANISDFKKHLAWYFPPGTYEQPARIFVLTFENAGQATACKYAIRNILFPHLQYRSIHINDYHAETVDLASSFFVGY